MSDEIDWEKLARQSRNATPGPYSRGDAEAFVEAGTGHVAVCAEQEGKHGAFQYSHDSEFIAEACNAIRFLTEQQCPSCKVQLRGLRGATLARCLCGYVASVEHITFSIIKPYEPLP